MKMWFLWSFVQSNSFNHSIPPTPQRKLLSTMPPDFPTISEQLPFLHWQRFGIYASVDWWRWQEKCEMTQVPWIRRLFTEWDGIWQEHFTLNINISFFFFMPPHWQHSKLEAYWFQVERNTLKKLKDEHIRFLVLNGHSDFTKNSLAWSSTFNRTNIKSRLVSRINRWTFWWLKIRVTQHIFSFNSKHTPHIVHSICW